MDRRFSRVCLQRRRDALVGQQWWKDAAGQLAQTIEGSLGLGGENLESCSRSCAIVAEQTLHIVELFGRRLKLTLDASANFAAEAAALSLLGRHDPLTRGAEFSGLR